jgi:hypothetical protein
MRRNVLAGAWALAVACSCLATPPALAQTGGKISVSYGPSAFPGLQTRLQQRQVLQELAQFLSPLRLPRNL